MFYDRVLRLRNALLSFAIVGFDFIDELLDDELVPLVPLDPLLHVNQVLLEHFIAKLALNLGLYLLQLCLHCLPGLDQVEFVVTEQNLRASLRVDYAPLVVCSNERFWHLLSDRLQRATAIQLPLLPLELLLEELGMCHSDLLCDFLCFVHAVLLPKNEIIAFVVV